MSAIFIMKSLQTVVKGPLRRRFRMYNEKKIRLLLLYLANQQKIDI